MSQTEIPEASQPAEPSVRNDLWRLSFLVLTILFGIYAFGLVQHHLSLLDYPRAVDYGETPEIARAWTIRNGGNIFTDWDPLPHRLQLHPTLLHHQRHIYPVHGASSVHRTAHLNAVLFGERGAADQAGVVSRSHRCVAGGWRVFIQSHHLDVERACACRQPRADVSALCSGLCIRGAKR